MAGGERASPLSDGRDARPPFANGKIICSETSYPFTGR